MKPVLMYLLVVFILILTSINIKNYLAQIDVSKNQKVLGAQSVNDSSAEFWTEFTSKNPNYIPGWLELGRMDKVKEIDPNFIP